VSAALALALAAGLTAWFQPRESVELSERADAAALAEPEPLSIAVLPFANMSGDREQDYFADGITADVITNLSRFENFFVISRTSSFAYKDKSVKSQDIGRELGVFLGQKQYSCC